MLSVRLSLVVEMMLVVFHRVVGAMLVPKLLMRMLVLPAYLIPNRLVLVLLGMRMFLVVKIFRRRISRLEVLVTVMRCKMLLTWRRCHPRMMIYFCQFFLTP